MDLNKVVSSRTVHVGATAENKSTYKTVNPQKSRSKTGGMTATFRIKYGQRKYTDFDLESILGGHDLGKYGSYKQYVDSFITDREKNYIMDTNMARALIENDTYQMRDICKKDTFYAIKAQAETRARLALNKSVSVLFDLKNNDILRHLQTREESNRNGSMCTIIFIRDKHPTGQHEISGYIDYAHRLRTDDMEEVFSGSVKFLPRKGDLSYMDYRNYRTFHKHSPNYKVIAESVDGIRFMNKKDRKTVTPLERRERTEIRLNDYLQVVMYDHKIMQRYN